MLTSYSITKDLKTNNIWYRENETICPRPLDSITWVLSHLVVFHSFCNHMTEAHLASLLIEFSMQEY